MAHLKGKRVLLVTSERHYAKPITDKLQKEGMWVVVSDHMPNDPASLHNIQEQILSQARRDNPIDAVLMFKPGMLMGKADNVVFGLADALRDKKIPVIVCERGVSAAKKQKLDEFGAYCIDQAKPEQVVNDIDHIVNHATPVQQVAPVSPAR